MTLLRTIRRAITASLFAPCLASCGSGPSVQGPPTIGLATEGQPLPAMPVDRGGPPQPWETMSREAKQAYMQTHVLPTMAPLFRELDPERYASFDCATCHGSRRNHFRMPNPMLPVLPVPESPAWNAMIRERGHVFAFMAERVEPAMARTLGLEPYDPATRAGFSCFDCHVQDE